MSIGPIELCAHYQLFLVPFRGRKILLLEPVRKTRTNLYRNARSPWCIFAVLNGVLVGKPMDETYYDVGTNLAGCH